MLALAVQESRDDSAVWDDDGGRESSDMTPASQGLGPCHHHSLTWDLSPLSEWLPANIFYNPIPGGWWPGRVTMLPCDQAGTWAGPLATQAPNVAVCLLAWTHYIDIYLDRYILIATWTVNMLGYCPPLTRIFIWGRLVKELWTTNLRFS